MNGPATDRPVPGGTGSGGRGSGAAGSGAEGNGADRDGAGAPAGAVRWRSPQVLLPLFACVLAAGYAVRTGPPPRQPAPTLPLQAERAPAAPPQETVLYAVDEDGLARPIVRDLPAPEDTSERLQGMVDALRAEMTAEGAWPEALPAPTVYAFTLQREDVVVLDVPAVDVRLGVARERAILASLERTLVEQGVDRIAYLRGGRAVPAWLGTVAVPNALD